MSKPVRREIRALTDSDRTKFLDTLQTTYTTSQSEGEALYGRKFRSITRMVVSPDGFLARLASLRTQAICFGARTQGYSPPPLPLPPHLPPTQHNPRASTCSVRRTKSATTGTTMRV